MSLESRVCATALALLVSACGQPELPPIPAPDLTELPAEVAAQLGEARERAAEVPAESAPAGELALLFHAYGYLEAADAAYRRARALAPRDGRWAYYHGDVLERLGRTGDAIAAFEHAVKWTPRHARAARLRLADLLDKSGDDDGARALYMKVLEAAPGDAVARYGLGKLALEQGDYERAVEYLEAALAAAGDFGGGHYALATALRALGDHERAAAHFTKFVEFRHRTLILDRTFNDRLRSRIASDRADIARALNHVRDGEVLDAIRAFESALEHDPGNASTHTTLIGLYAALGDQAGAERHYEAARALDPTLPRIYFNMGLALRAAGRIDEALGQFALSVDIEPENAALRTAFAQTLEESGDIDAAIAQYARALDTEPGLASTRALLMRSLVAAGRANEAIAVAGDEVIPAGGQGVELLRQLAAAHLAAGDEQRAFATLERARIRAGNDAALVAGVNSDEHRFRARLNEEHSD